MLEEIKKKYNSYNNKILKECVESCSFPTIRQNILGNIYDEIIHDLEILDKHQDKYKQMWEALYSEVDMPCSIQYMQELEAQYLGDDE